VGNLCPARPGFVCALGGSFPAARSAAPQAGSARPWRPTPPEDGRVGGRHGGVGARVVAAAWPRERPGLPGTSAAVLAPAGGKLALRNVRGDRGNVGIIRSPIRASILPDDRKFDDVPFIAETGGSKRNGGSERGAPRVGTRVPALAGYASSAD
jgi:hypothetical protein